LQNLKCLTQLKKQARVNISFLADEGKDRRCLGCKSLGPACDDGQSTFLSRSQRRLGILCGLLADLFKVMVQLKQAVLRLDIVFTFVNHKVTSFKNGQNQPMSLDAWTMRLRGDKGVSGQLLCYFSHANFERSKSKKGRGSSAVVHQGKTTYLKAMTFMRTTAVSASPTWRARVTTAAVKV
jgi:hypothetical protein